MAGVRDVAGPGARPPAASPAGKRGPSRGRPGPDKPPKSPKDERTIPYREGVVKKGLTKFYGLLALMVMMIDAETGMVIMKNAEALASSWEILARQNPKIRRVLYGLISTSAWGTVLTAHVPIFIMVMRKAGPEGVRELMGMLINATDGSILISQDPGEAAFNLADLVAEMDAEEPRRGAPDAPPADVPPDAASLFDLAPAGV